MRLLTILIAIAVFPTLVYADLADELKDAKKLTRQLEREKPVGYETLLDDLADGLALRVESAVRAAAVAVDLAEEPGNKATKAAQQASDRFDLSQDAETRKKRLKLLKKSLGRANKTVKALRKRSPDKATALEAPVATILDNRIDESSGLAFWHGDFWTMNDGGAVPVLYRSETADFAAATAYPVPGATNVDWEDLAVHEGDLIVADIGDNGLTRDNLVLYRVTFDGKALSLVATYDVGYPDGTHDAEAVASIDGTLHVITKDRGEGTNVYRFGDLQEGITNTGELLGSIEFENVGEPVTAADYDAETGELVILTYFGVHFFDATHPMAGPARSIPLFALQMEGLALAGDLIVITNEQQQVFAALRQ